MSLQRVFISLRNKWDVSGNCYLLVLVLCFSDRCHPLSNPPLCLNFYGSLSQSICLSLPLSFSMNSQNSLWDYMQIHHFANGGDECIDWASHSTTCGHSDISSCETPFKLMGGACQQGFIRGGYLTLSIMFNFI